MTGSPDQFTPRVYRELRAVAGRYFKDERADHTLQPTALVHEAYARLADANVAEGRSRDQFFVLAAKAMRNILVDHARARGREKRGGGWRRITLDGAVTASGSEETVDVEALDAAMDRLAALDERKASLVELRFFVGLTSEQAAEALGISRTLASNEWRVARAWLYRELSEEDADG